MPKKFREAVMFGLLMAFGGVLYAGLWVVAAFVETCHWIGYGSQREVIVRYRAADIGAAQALQDEFLRYLRTSSGSGVHHEGDGYDCRIYGNGHRRKLERLRRKEGVTDVEVQEIYGLRRSIASWFSLGL